MTAQQQEALKPCPFCGSKARFEIDVDGWQWVECSSCGMQGNRSASLMEDCKPKLIEAWNRRAPVVPQGWTLVPEFPTQEMCDAAKYTVHAGLSVFKWADGYKAMLAAAPEPQEKP